MKSFAGSEELQASFRSIGTALIRAEALYFWFGSLGTTAAEPLDLPTAYDFLKQELVGIKTGDLELYLEDLRTPREKNEPFPEHLALPEPDPPVTGIGIVLRAVMSKARRQKMFEEAIERETRRRHGESDDGDTPIPAGYPLRVSSAVK